MPDAYELVTDFYGARTAARSGVPLINHIDEGLVILRELGVCQKTKDAFALHPLFQNDEDLLSNYRLLKELDGEVAALVMEYRSTANYCLSDQVELIGDSEFHFKQLPRLSPIRGVNDMLRADKVQNRKDFELYHADSHPRARELAEYFRQWLKVLSISEECYQGFKARL